MTWKLGRLLTCSSRSRPSFLSLTSSIISCSALLLITTTIEAQIPERAWRYRALFREEVSRAGLTEHRATLAAQVHQESAWREGARSPFAEGLAQFTPETRAWINRMDPLLLEIDDAFNPRWAMRAQMVYMRWLLDRQEAVPCELERWAFSLRGYNGGEGWIARERQACQGDSLVDPLKNFDSLELCCGRPDARGRRRSAANCLENVEYPRRILFRWRPVYEGF